MPCELPPLICTYMYMYRFQKFIYYVLIMHTPYLSLPHSLSLSPSLPSPSLPRQPPEESEHPLPMEYLSVNEGWGQSYGYVMYRTRLPSHSKQVTIHDLRDYGVVRKIISLKILYTCACTWIFLL